jgi:copper transport protein
LASQHRLILVLAALVAAAFLASGASAHAFLIRSEPVAGTSVKVAPTHVLLEFDEAVAPARIAVTNSEGKSVRAGGVIQPKHTQISIPLEPNLPRGGYVVHWSEVDEDDGHRISGALGFGVGTAAPTVSAQGGSDFRPGDAATRWLLLIGLLVGSGVVFFRRFVWRPASVERFIVAAAVALGLAAVAAGILLTLQPDAFATRFEKVTFAGAIVALVAALLLFASLIWRPVLVVADVLALALLALPTLDGHAVAPGVAHWLSVPSDLVHVCGAAVWIGGVFSLIVLAPREEAVRRFAPFAGAAVVAIAITGVLRAISELSSVSQLWTTSYGKAILVKSVLFLAVVATAAAARGRPGRRTIAFEGVLLFALVAAVAVLIGLRPGRDTLAQAAAPGPAPFVTAAPIGSYAVGVSLTQATDGVRAEATVLGIDGPANGLDVTITVAGNAQAGEKCGDGCYAAVAPVQQPTSLRVKIGKSSASFRVPELWPAPSAGAAVAAATRSFRALRSVTIDSRLASSPTNATKTIYRMAAPNRITGVEPSTGAAEVIIGGRRWDRDSANAKWEQSAAVPVRQPSTPWPPGVRDAHYAGDETVLGRTLSVVTFYDPLTPAWFAIHLDPNTGRTYAMDMIATAHFMREDYRGFNKPLEIVPPR